MTMDDLEVGEYVTVLREREEKKRTEFDAYEEARAMMFGRRRPEPEGNPLLGAVLRVEALSFPFVVVARLYPTPTVPRIILDARLVELTALRPEYVQLLTSVEPPTRSTDVLTSSVLREAFTGLMGSMPRLGTVTNRYMDSLAISGVELSPKEEKPVEVEIRIDPGTGDARVFDVREKKPTGEETAATLREPKTRRVRKAPKEKS